ncbi:MAG: TraR/DksA C4-type zinc finger protein, partial [Acidimicrobiales bacterium]
AKPAKTAKPVPAVPAVAKPAKTAKPVPAVPAVAKPAKPAKPVPAVPAARKGAKAAPAVAKPAKASGKSAGKARPGHGAPTTEHAASAEGAPAVAKAPGLSQTRVTKAPAPARKPPGRAARPGPARPGGGLGLKAESSKRVGEGYAKDERFLAGQRSALLRERATYLDQAASLKAEAEALVEEMEPGDIQFDDESGEGGTVTVDRERDLALSAQAMAAVEEIDHALLKMDNGTYGICENCGRSIVKARLEALPYARLCIDCKSGGLSRR